MSDLPVPEFPVFNGWLSGGVFVANVWISVSYKKGVGFLFPPLTAITILAPKICNADPLFLLSPGNGKIISIKSRAVRKWLE
jgi:hypothetical protein